MAGSKRTVTKSQINGVGTPAPAPEQLHHPAQSTSGGSNPASDTSGDTESNKLQRLLTIMEVLGKLVEKEDAAVSAPMPDTDLSEPEQGKTTSPAPGTGENTREIVATIASLLVEKADLEAIKERLSPDNHQAVELLAQLSEFIKGENKSPQKELKGKGKAGEPGEPTQKSPSDPNPDLGANLPSKAELPGTGKGELDVGSSENARGGTGHRDQGRPGGSESTATAAAASFSPSPHMPLPSPEISLIESEKEAKNKGRRKRLASSANSTGTEAVRQLILDMDAHQDPASIEKIKLGTARREGQTEEEWITILSSAFYHATREALSLNTFVKSEGSPWPTAPLNRGGASGLAQLLPPVIQDEPLMPVEDVDRWVEMMWKQREELSDLDADALDMLCHVWLEQASKPEDSAVAEIDRFLEMRGLQKKKSGNNRRGGFTLEQRREILRALSHIQSIWLKLGQIEVFEDHDDGGSSKNKKKRQSVTKAFESRAFVVTDRMGQLKMDGYMDVERFIYQPGKLFAQFLFGPGRQTAILSAKAIQYDRYRQKWEKRLARYFSWQWRIQAAKGDYTRPYRVSTLLKAVGESVDERHPNATRDRLEKALDRLQTDNVLASWQYDRWEEKVTEQRGWVEHWLQATLLLEPPESIRQTYNSLERTNFDTASSPRALRLQAASAATEVDETLQLVRDLRNKRLEIGMSQSVCAEKLGIAQGVLSRLEKAKLKPSVQLQQRIRKWLKTLD